MRKRVLGVVLSIALAGVGVFLTLAYVNKAEERAVAAEETVEVLVVENTIVAGERAQDIGGRIKAVLVPAKVQAAGSVASLADLEGKVAAVDLQPGEQVLESRFITEEELVENVGLQIPEGLLEVTIAVAPDRALGGELQPGDMVAVVASFEPFQVQAIEPGEIEEFFGATVEDDENRNLRTPNTSHIILHKILVTYTAQERLPAPTDREDAAEEGVELAPTGNLLVTMAMSAPDVERVVFSAEHGTVWLAREPANASESGTQIQTRGTIYR